MSNRISPVRAHALKERDAAHFLGVSQSYLRQARMTGTLQSREAPPYVRLGGGRTIRYLVSDLETYLSQHRVAPGIQEDRP